MLASIAQMTDVGVKGWPIKRGSEFSCSYVCKRYISNHERAGNSKRLHIVYVVYSWSQYPELQYTTESISPYSVKCRNYALYKRGDSGNSEDRKEFLQNGQPYVRCFSCR